MLVFTACTAKSGTYYIGNVLNNHPECYVINEPRKRQGNFFGIWLSRRGNGDLKNAESLWKNSLEQIYDNLSNAPIYIESDFRFIGYNELVFRDLSKDHTIKVLILKREKAKVARQIVRNHYYSGNYTGWLLLPNFAYNIIPLDSNDSLTKGVWYTFEVEARIERMKRSYAYIEFFEFDMDKEKFPQWKELVKFLNIDLTDKMIKIIEADRIINTWENRPDVIKIPELELDNVRKKVEEFGEEIK